MLCCAVLWSLSASTGTRHGAVPVHGHEDRRHSRRRVISFLALFSIFLFLSLLEVTYLYGAQK